MSEQTYTITYSGLGGLTFHFERDKAVMWTETSAEIVATRQTFSPVLNWYGDSMSERYTVEE